MLAHIMFKCNVCPVYVHIYMFLFCVLVLFTFYLPKICRHSETHLSYSHVSSLKDLFEHH